MCIYLKLVKSVCSCIQLFFVSIKRDVQKLSYNENIVEMHSDLIVFVRNMWKMF